MNCDLTSCSTVFKSYDDNGRVIMEGLCSGNLLPIGKIPAGLEPGTARSVGQRSTC